MKKILLLVTFVSMVILTSCGISAEEKAKMELARQDSIKAAEDAMKAAEEAAAAAASAAATDTTNMMADTSMHHTHDH